MLVKTDKVVELPKVLIGDIIQFNHTGTDSKQGFYLVCRDNTEGYFIMNLSGRKSRLTYYGTIKELLLRHAGSILNIFPADEYRISLEKLGADK